MNYSSLISCRKQYKYSSNISFDLNNEEKLSEFIPDGGLVDILKEFYYGIRNNEDTKSKILYGSYGSGKSHLLTVLSAILSLTNVNTDSYKVLIERIAKYDSTFAKDLISFTKKNKPYLLVTIDGNDYDFEKCVTLSIKKALENEGIKYNFKNYYDEASTIIENWTNNSDSLKRLKDLCKKEHINYTKLTKAIKNYDDKVKPDFEQLFKKMTYGATYISSPGNMVDNLLYVNNLISKKYRGIVFIFDEFGRYVEDFENEIRVKSIQDLAEFCDHSSYNNTLILVSHKQLSLYIDKMSDDANEEWKKIEGRFKDISMTRKYNQSFSIISDVISKTKNWASFKKRYSRELNRLYNQSWGFKGFVLPSEQSNPFEECYPLHPITLYCLERLSSRVAQNNRTFFTYLAGDDDNSLLSQLKRLDTNSFHFIGLDSIYDYFESSIKSYKSKDVIFIYQQLQNSLSKIQVASIEGKILKTIAIIKIIADSNVLDSTESQLINLIDASKKDIESAIKNLQKKKIIKFMRQYSSFEFWNSSIYDIDLMISENIKSITDSQVFSTLNDEFSYHVLYPYDYNFAYHMNRVFIPLFLSSSDFEKDSYKKRLPEYYDGILAMVLGKIDDKNIKKIPLSNVIVNNCDDNTILKEVKRYIAIKYLSSISTRLSEDDPAVVNEIAAYLQEQKDVVSTIIDNWSALNMRGIKIYIEGKLKKIKDLKELSLVASRLMFNYYPQTIIVNNDLINKNNLSGAMRVARNKAITYIMENDNPLDLCQVMSPEHTIIRSVLSLNNMIEDSTVESFNRLPDDNISGMYVSKVINGYLKKCSKNPISLDVLYKTLKESPYGLRDGYIPVLFSSELKKFANVTIFTHGQEKEYCCETLIKAFDNPSDYSFYTSKWTEEQNDYVQQLMNVFSDFVTTDSKNSPKDIYNAMNKHYSSLPKSARTTNSFVTSETKKYRSMMSESYNNYSDFIFNTLTGFNSTYKKLIATIQNIKYDLETVPEKQITFVISGIKNVLNIKKDGLLVKTVSDTYNKKWKDKCDVVFDYHTNSFLKLCGEINDIENDYDFVNRLSNALIGFDADYWSDEMANEIISIFEQVVSNLNNYKRSANLESGENIISLQTGDKEIISKRFDEIDLSNNAKMMFNKIISTIDSFGESISYEEKMQIIAELIRKVK